MSILKSWRLGEALGEKKKMAAGFSCRPKWIEKVQPSGFESQGGGTHLVLPGLGPKLLCIFFWFGLWSLLVRRGRAQYIYIYAYYNLWRSCTSTIRCSGFPDEVGLGENPLFCSSCPHETSGISGPGTPELVVFGVGQMRDLVERKKKSPKILTPLLHGDSRPVDRLVNCGIFWILFGAEAYDPRAAETDGRQL